MRSTSRGVEGRVADDVGEQIERRRRDWRVSAVSVTAVRSRLAPVPIVGAEPLLRLGELAPS